MFDYRRRTGLLKWIIGVTFGAIAILVITMIILKSTNSSGGFLAYTCVSDQENYTLSESSEIFDLKLFHQILQESTENLILSTHSVASVLAMLMLGAKGETFTELAEVLTIPCGDNGTDLYLDGFKIAQESLQVFVVNFVYFVHLKVQLRRFSGFS